MAQDMLPEEPQPLLAVRETLSPQLFGMDTSGHGLLTRATGLSRCQIGQMADPDNGDRVRVPRGGTEYPPPPRHDHPGPLHGRTGVVGDRDRRRCNHGQTRRHYQQAGAVFRRGVASVRDCETAVVAGTLHGPTVGPVAILHGIPGGPTLSRAIRSGEVAAR